MCYQQKGIYLPFQLRVQLIQISPCKSPLETSQHSSNVIMDFFLIANLFEAMPVFLPCEIKIKSYFLTAHSAACWKSRGFRHIKEKVLIGFCPSLFFIKIRKNMILGGLHSFLVFFPAICAFQSSGSHKDSHWHKSLFKAHSVKALPLLCHSF